MEFLTREAIMSNMTNSLTKMLHNYQLEDVGVFEEEGEDDRYYIGYTIRKDGKVFMIHQPFLKNVEGQFAPLDNEWVIESEEVDWHGFDSLDDVFNHINEVIYH